MHALLTDRSSPAQDAEPALLLQALARLRAGEPNAGLPPHWDGLWGRIADNFNAVVQQNLRLSHELTRLARAVGKQGRLKERARMPDVGGFWAESAQAVNGLIAALVHPTAEVARVIGAVAQGDLSKTMDQDIEGRPLQGEFLRTATTINRMVQQLGTFAAEVTRVAREVGTEGKLGGQADVQGVAGTWKDLTDNVNSMASNLTSQVRNIADVTKAVAAGDLSRKITVDVQGEILGLKNTINTMVDQLRGFASEVTRVACEVGAQGILGGQAQVPGAAGTWKALTENVNQLAANLTTQVRAIAEVATAVTQGDLTRSVTVQARGEVAALKDTINEMIRNLRDTTQLNTEQDWLKTHLARFSRLLQGQKDLQAVAQMVLGELAQVVGAQRSGFYLMESVQGTPRLRLMASHAAAAPLATGPCIALGEGVVGQCALDRRKVLLSGHLPASAAIRTGLTQLSPRCVLVLPIVFEGQVRGVLELSSLDPFSSTHQVFLDQLAESIGIVINTLQAKTRTEDLLAQSQSLAHELQSRQLELQHTNEALQEKARQVALTSKYKSEFLANMSHELRTPLNSLLILSEQLSRNAEGNLTARQVEFAKTIHSSGNDLLMLINDILDLSKIESGTVVVDLSELRLSCLQRYVERNFRHVAEARGVAFQVECALRPSVALRTDVKRLQQILKNLLSNAFKFTLQGRVRLDIREAREGWSPQHPELSQARRVLAFAVSDTGIGIPGDKQQIIFDAFQQADGSTSRKYGGTGLGLAISRELSRLLGGEIRLVSTPGQGSTFTLYLPLRYTAARTLAPSDAATAPTARPVRRAPARPRRMQATDGVENEEGALAAAQPPVWDDREHLRPCDAVLLIVLGDMERACLLLEAARACGFKGLVSTSGAGALALSSARQPAAVLLGDELVDMPGGRLLSRFQHDLALRHIPICRIGSEGSVDLHDILATLPWPQDPEATRAMLGRLRAYGARRQRRILVALKDLGLQREFLALVEDDLIQPTVVRSAERAAFMLQRDAFDTLVLDAAWITTPGGSLRSVLQALPAPPETGLPGPLPLVLHTPATTAGCVQGLGPGLRVLQAHGAVGLFEATLRQLHHPVQRMPEERRALLQQALDVQRPLAGQRVLIVDDDMRNIFALATVLEEHGMDIVWAESGREAIHLTASDPQIAVVLMDIMMPELDGLATMREIRRQPRGRTLPLIAVTAQAMKGDREKCIEAGAWDYLSKPVNPHELLTALRAWLQP
jgi:signal transduction histidine kinase/CheY-like chemotaxis protein/HAMP domain-containing protein